MVVDPSPRALAPCLPGPLTPALLPALQERVEHLQEGQGEPRLLAGVSTALDTLANVTVEGQVVVITSAMNLAKVEAVMLDLATERKILMSALLVGKPNTATPSLPHLFITPNSDLPSLLVPWLALSPTSPLPHFSPVLADPLTGLASVAVTLAAPPGVVGVVVDLRSLAQEVLYHPRGGETVGLVDGEGRAVLSPGLGSGGVGHCGEFVSSVRRYEGDVEVGGRRCTWRRVGGTPYTVVVSSPSGGGEVAHLPPVPYSSHTSDLLYHEHVLASTSKLCRHLRQAATLGAAALHLAPAAFAAPYAHLAAGAVPLRTQSFMAYLTDPTRLIVNPGLAAGVRPAVATVARLVEEWRAQAETSPLNNYIVRRRAGTPQGALLSYPGTRAGAPEQDFTVQPWYAAAAAAPGTLVVAAPALDPGGAGFTVTMSQAVTANATTGEASVLAMDLTLGYFYKVVHGPGPVCGVQGARCLLLDSTGFLLSHPADALGPRHLTAAEPLLASALLHRGDVMVKRECRREDGLLQRFFTLHLPEEGVVRSAEGACTEWEVGRVPGTTLLLAWVRARAGCQDAPAFCWCSTIDRTCLDCQAMEQAECECPCECASQEDVCTAARRPAPPPCAPLPPPSAPGRHSTVRLDRLPPCVHTTCQGRATRAQCAGVLGCSWCSQAEGGAPLTAPFCGSQETCYNGVVASPSPYSLHSRRPPVAPRAGGVEPAPLRASPIGPVAGGVMGVFLVLAVVAWAYRHWSTGDRRLAAGASLTRVDQEEVVVGHLNYGGEGAAGGGVGGQGVVSPYRMNPGYRRPRPAGTESDHGYSTMTPVFGDQDSEIMSCMGEVVRRPAAAEEGRSTSPPVVGEEGELVGLVEREQVPGMTVMPHTMVVAALVHTAVT